MATQYNNKSVYDKHELRGLNAILEGYQVQTMLIVGAHDITNWLNLELELANIVDKSVDKLIHKNIN